MSFLCLIGTALDYLDETFNNSPIPRNIIDNSGGQNSVSMIDKSPHESTSVEVNCVDDAMKDDDVILLNSYSLVKARYFTSCFKGISIRFSHHTYLPLEYSIFLV